MILDYDGYLLDVDGVIWINGKEIPGSVETVNRLHDMGKAIVFLTNNSTKSRDEYVKALRDVGISWVGRNDIVSSAYVAARYLSGLAERCYVIGEAGLVGELRLAGLEVLDESSAWSSGADAVVVGMDRNFNYMKLWTAMKLILEGSLYVATNTDRSFPTERGLAPGAGTMVAAVSAGAGTEPIVVGKPSEHIFREALRSVGDGKVLMIGDRAETDILGATKIGIDSAFVLSGAGKTEDLRALGLEPKYVAEDLKSLFRSFI